MIRGVHAGLHTRGDFEREIRTALLNRLPTVMREREFPCWVWKEFDKAFACEWLDSETVVVGTKCNKLLCLNTTTRQFQRVAMPRAPPRPAGAAQADPAAPVTGCGIHSIALSPDRRLLATGGANPSDCQILAVRDGGAADAAPGAQQLAPVQTLVGHTDWVFGIAWVTDRHVVTGSRDQHVKLWKVDTEPGCSPNQQPLVSEVPALSHTREERNYKVRDVKFSPSLGRLATLTTNGCVQFWDPHCIFERNVRLKHSKEVVCLAMSDSLLAVGSQSHITLVDPRKKTAVQDIESLDDAHGVRSLNFLDHLLSCGSGQGKLFFYDLRASAYLDLSPVAEQPHLSSVAAPERGCLQCGTGYLNMSDPVYLEHFSHEQVFNACYSHAWDPSQTRLAAVGGPLAYGLRGTYMSVWS
ncbi:DDB1- and CUL4-associated factor 12 [Coccomyxa sp. Obi]|nr:DDB1- and CUL4-associated factor 12 [Coccomyxa sp. Obi]